MLWMRGMRHAYSRTTDAPSSGAMHPTPLSNDACRLPMAPITSSHQPALSTPWSMAILSMDASSSLAAGTLRWRAQPCRRQRSVASFSCSRSPLRPPGCWSSASCTMAAASRCAALRQTTQSCTAQARSSALTSQGTSSMPPRVLGGVRVRRWSARCTTALTLLGCSMGLATALSCTRGAAGA